MSDFDTDPFATGPGPDPFATGSGPDPFATGPAREPVAAERFPYGRQAVAEVFRQFATDSPGGTGLHLTGSPGTGRSTLLMWLYLLSDRGRDGAGRIFHAALGARGRGVDDLAGAIGAQLGYEVDTAAELLAVLSVDERPVCIAIGEVDEAGPVPTPAAAERLLNQLLVPLAQLPGVRLVTEGPREWSARLAPTQVVDLDEPRWTDRAAFGRYVDAMCAYAPDEFVPGSAAHPLHTVEARLRFARTVAERTFPNFLLAQVVVLDQLSAAPELLEPTDDPSGDLAEAVHRHLRRWSGTVPIAADALLALALAGPDGFDESDWLATIGLVTQRKVRRSELDEVVDLAGALVGLAHADSAEAAADPAERYCLRHPAIGSALLLAAGPEREQQARRALAYALAGRVPVERGTDGSVLPRWSAVAPVLVSDLLRQASAVGVLAPLLEYPELLLRADLDELRAAAEATEEPGVVALRPVLRLLQPSSPDLPSRLQAAAVQHGLHALAAATDAACAPLAFRCLDLTETARPGPAVADSTSTAPRTGQVATPTGPVPQPGGESDRSTPDRSTPDGGSRSARAVLSEEGTLGAVRSADGTDLLGRELGSASFSAARIVVLDEVPVVLAADREAVLNVLRLDDGNPLLPAVETIEPAELVDLLSDGAVPLSVCAAGDLLWVTRLSDGATLARHRLGRGITAISVDADHLVHVGSGSTRIRFAFDLDLLRAAPATTVWADA